MIVPLIGLYIASLVCWFIASILTFGYSEYISTSVTGAFITLFGIHTALQIKGAAKPIEFSTMALYAFVFGLMIHAAKAAMTFAAYHLSLFVTEKRLSHLGSWETIKNVDEAAHGAFVLHGFGLTVIFY